MPIEIKDKRTGEFRINALGVRTTRCGHCDYPIQDDALFLVFDEPYFCAIHDSCLYSFEWNGLNRSPQQKGRKEAVEHLDGIQAVLHEMVSRPWWQKSKATKRYHAALLELLNLHQSLRKSGVIPENLTLPDNDSDNNNDNVKREGMAAAAPQTLQMAKMTQRNLDKLVADIEIDSKK